MSFVGKVWKLLVGIKDGLVLIFMLLFFIALFSVLSSRPSPGQVRDGALVIELNGFVVEERSAIDPFATLLSGEAPVSEYQARDLIRAIDAAADDDRIQAVVLDMSGFIGGGQVHLQAIGEAMERVRATEKPVLAYAFGYADDHLLLAAHASEVWLDDFGGAVVAGPGGSSLYYADLLDRLQVNARIYRVGTFKSAVEPYSRNSMSAEARENIGGLYATLWEEWQANVRKARPNLDIDRVTSDPVGWVNSANGDLAEAALDAGLVDQLGDRIAFGERVAEIVGEDSWSEDLGSYAHTDFGPFLADITPSNSGSAIGVVTVAGTIVDGNAGPGTAGGDRIARILNKALDDDLAGLVVRVDSPGGSVTASEEIRRAIDRFREKDIPVAISFANVAASGGYWVATAGDRIFAQPETITGSIGVFSIIPTFEGTAAELGVASDGYRSTPLSGQPDLIGGFSPEVDGILQAGVGDTYSDFLSRVADARDLTTERVDEIGQGRVWDGGTARQLGLVDQFGGIDDALAWVAAQAELEDGDWYANFLGNQEAQYDSLIRQMLTDDGSRQTASARQGPLYAMIARQQSNLVARLSADVALLSGKGGVQAYCLECPVNIAHQPQSDARGMLEMLRALVVR
ncbi:MAG: signal peptide peptidase SppA [Erythrobacter sp.]